MPGLFEELQSLMAKHAFRPERRLSQNFLISQEAIEEIVSAASLSAKDIVLEIGCGTGFLTCSLLKHCRVEGFELDEKLCRVLESEVKDKKFSLHCEDFLNAKLPKFSKIVSAPPYGISSQLMHLLFKQEFESAVLVFEKAFAEKITAFPGLRDYCATAVLSQYFFRIELLQQISPGAFFPKPSTPSQIARLESAREHGKACDELLFEGFVEQLFRHKNKNLSNSLEHSKEWIAENLKFKGEFSKALSAELLGRKVNLVEVEEFVQLFNSVCKK